MWSGRTISTSPAKPSQLKRNIFVAVVILFIAIAAFEAGTSSSKPSGTQSVVTVTAVQTATVVQTVSVVRTSTTEMTTTGTS
jgi:hypothetical protein